MVIIIRMELNFILKKLFFALKKGQTYKQLTSIKAI